MNKRIEQLAEQAGMHRDKFGMYFAGDKHNEDGVDLEKFAELIVRECAVPMITQARAMDADAGYKNNPIEVNTMHLHQGLLKHFGVEL